MKKILALSLSVLIITALIFTSGAQTNIVDNMTFAGEKTQLSLEQAIQKVIADNSGIKGAMTDIEEYKISQEKLSDIKKDIKKGRTIKDGSTYDYEVKVRDLVSKNLTDASARNLEATKKSTTAKVEELYYGLLNAKKELDIYQANYDIAKDLLNKTNKKFELGLIARQEVITSEQNLIAAENKLNSASNALKTSKMDFNILLGYDVMADVEPVGSLTFKEEKIDGIAASVSTALIERNEVKNADYNLKYEEMKMKIVAGKYAEITYNYRAQKLKVEQAQKDYTDMLKNIEKDVRQKYMKVSEKLDAVKSGEKSVQLAEEKLKISTLSFDKGMAILTDVQAAQNNVLQAKLDLTKAILGYKLAVSDYKDSAGIGRNTVMIQVPADLLSIPVELMY